MTVYITQGRYSDKAIKGMIAKPEDRAIEVAKLAKASGFKLVDYYVTFGDADFMVIFEGDGDVEALGMLLAAGAGGGVTDLHTTVAVRSSDAVKAMKKSGKLTKAFRTAGT